ncbi:MAG TPA: respiratory nitrate reductase subunit gamma [Chiayiivirga sp.]|jgi:nitrate reductase gamma subunit|nr:respiratory nitrate reductase subunit gamma [Xanthomonadaceae bacterium]MDX9764314.1 respiratory nitrate reductase subunit gamma [Chiayiivirga sp.]HMN34674.1 respiratory nitrate reductase subunit gamma [Chiayiivirga sp.]HRN58868.1 respiratory nitrate reductase subunit gamma [Chiayiivirga sp.]HRO88010.1 respiratory nitrate reductase subunit gamma [Chiayiivirga sp.]
MSHVDTFAFQIYPYIALAVFFIGSWARFDRAMFTWRAGSSQLLSDKGMRWGSNLFHIGILAILAGHLVGLLTPHWVYEPFITVPQKQLLAMVVGGAFGAVCLVGISILTLRRLTNPRVRATGTFADTAILLLLFAQLLLGLYTIVESSKHMDGGVMMALAEWAQRIVTFRGGAAEFVAGVSWVYKAHIFLGLTLFLLTPFTRLVHVWSIPLSYLWRPYQVVRRRQPPLRYGPRA